MYRPLPQPPQTDAAPVKHGLAYRTVYSRGNIFGLMVVLTFFPGVLVVAYAPPGPGTWAVLGVCTVVGFAFFCAASCTQGCVGNVTTVNNHGDTRWLGPAVTPGAVVLPVVGVLSL